MKLIKIIEIQRFSKKIKKQVLEKKRITYIKTLLLKLIAHTKTINDECAPSKHNKNASSIALSTIIKTINLVFTFK